MHSSKPYSIIYSPQNRTFITLMFMLKTKQLHQKVKGALLILNNPDVHSNTLLKKFISVHKDEFPEQIISLLQKAILPNINTKKGTIASFVITKTKKVA